MPGRLIGHGLPENAGGTAFPRIACPAPRGNGEYGQLARVERVESEKRRVEAARIGLGANRV